MKYILFIDHLWHRYTDSWSLQKLNSIESQKLTNLWWNHTRTSLWMQQSARTELHRSIHLLKESQHEAASIKTSSRMMIQPSTSKLKIAWSSKTVQSWLPEAHMLKALRHLYTSPSTKKAAPRYQVHHLMARKHSSNPQGITAWKRRYPSTPRKLHNLLYSSDLKHLPMINLVS